MSGLIIKIFVLNQTAYLQQVLLLIKIPHFIRNEMRNLIFCRTLVNF